MPSISILKELVQSSACVSITSNPYGRNIVTLVEPNQYSVTINGMPSSDDAIVIKIDNFPAPKSIFKGTKGECKRADFVIISKVGNKKIVIYIEIKSKATTSQARDIIRQLKGAQCVVKYAQEIGCAFWGSDPLDGFESRYVCLRNISISKRKTRINTSSSIHDSPERMLKINCPNNLQFNELVGRE